MKRYLVFLSLLGLCFLSTAWGAPLQLHVAVNGNDSWSGCMATAQDNDGPLASLEGARQAIRALKETGAFPEDGIEVLVHAGLYSMDAPFALTEEDSGTAQAPIVYQAAPGEKVRLLGGVVVSDFKAVDDPSILSRMDESRTWQRDDRRSQSTGRYRVWFPQGRWRRAFLRRETHDLVALAQYRFCAYCGCRGKGWT